MGKEEIARHEQFFLFPQCFLVNHIIVSPLVHIFDTISLFAAELKSLKLTYEVKVTYLPHRVKNRLVHIERIYRGQ